MRNEAYSGSPCNLGDPKCKYASHVFVKRSRTISAAMILFSLSVWRSAALSPNGVSAKQPGDYVVLLHGLGRTAWSMKGLEWDLRKEGYKVINVSYPSTRLSIQDAS